MSPDTSVLDNPIWHALTSAHAHLAEGDDLARRYPVDMGPLTGMKEQSTQAYASLAKILGPDDVSVLFLESPPTLPDGWRLLQCFPMEQMIGLEPPQINHHGFDIKELGAEDISEMRKLAEATEPGPFRRRTIELGGYKGIQADGQLASMAGQRCTLTSFIEVSAVCTWPEFRGRGYANALVSTVANGIFAQNKTPFLGVRQDNANAIRVYEKAGFRIRRALYVVVLKRPL
ncbi:GNAT family N-acetyltransferase [Alloacidobacterium sp.]|uniref:GNAT family N-acetyltransferase n=1 Tax=Alloacidobacterium sp. TaxID=2951999 RepID=UPI002D2B2CA8|nr:GNAT family N-acetyltransferase [Alloacidobacterium sp.]HYK37967.1 GNAT family N-acetyltransferase [Alloacidobacterium sp.]